MENSKTELRNNLNLSGSAYLKSAAHQPVNWQEWSDNILEIAKSENKPILLDIGAVWCHWCHVMDRESYEDPDIAKYINENFIAVKVDRDERPDVDRRYQTFVQSIGSGGGWPLTCFLTYEGNLFYGGTYFPPENRMGRPGFKNILNKISASYKSQHSEIIENSHSIFDKIIEFEENKTKSGDINQEITACILVNIEQNFDVVNGGFGNSTKFPNCSALELAMAVYNFTGKTNFMDIAQTTLDKMSLGGIHDHIGGGFHRYSIDQFWHVPHFEKMTTDNAELLSNFLSLYSITKEEKYIRTAENLIDWYTREMTDQENGGFYAHQDADIDLEDDGDYFTWKKEEIENTLNKKEAEVFNHIFGITEEPNDLHGITDRNVLYTMKKEGDVAKMLNISINEIEDYLLSAREKLLKERNKREAPFIDSTIFASYNGMMIHSYSQAYNILGRQDIKEFICKTVNFICSKMYKKDRGFAHSFIDGKDSVYGLLSDQVWMSTALLDTYELTGDTKYFDLALESTGFILENFEDREKGGFFDRIISQNESAIFSLKHKPFEDIPNTSSNAALIRLLDRLYNLTSEDKYKNHSENALKSFAGSTDSNGVYTAAYGLSLFLHIYPPPQVVIIGNKDAIMTKKLLDAARNVYRPGKEIYFFDINESLPDDTLELFKEKVEFAKSSNLTLAFVCAGNSCAAPVETSEELETLLREFGKS